MGRDLSALDIQYVRGVGPRRAELLARLGIRNVRDALYHLPARYEDRGDIRSIRDVEDGSRQSVAGRVVGAELVDLRRGGRRLFGPGRPSRGLSLFELSVSDGTGVIKGKWFNQPFMKKRFKVGQDVVLSGTVKSGRWGLEMDNPECVSSGGEGEDEREAGRVAPVYPATESLGPRQVRGVVHAVLAAHLDEVEDPLPLELRKRVRLPGLAESLAWVHRPPEDADADLLNARRTPWQKRLAFDELFLLETGLALLRRERGRERGIAFDAGGRLVKGFLAALPFRLTGDQERVFFEEILADMRASWRMNRMLQGDVGSGKTVVALMAVLTAVECGRQAALMAPTEILAEQHYLGIHRMVEDQGVRVCLLTGSTRDRPLGEIARGEVDLVIGTHALIQEGVRFRDLGLAVIDEQHRFGVMQRAVLRKKGLHPDVLIMTATPIPRTLALTLYGDLDYSVVRELPPGRTPVRTELHSPDGREAVYEAIRTEVGAGGQVYVVYPVIEESEKTSLKSALQGEEAMRSRFPGMRVALIHGRLRPAEKEAVMAGFQAGDIDILVSTTVIEVGVDVPNASLMVIVHAERFGLSQLHQLRGRVGRGRRRSRCLLLAYGPLGEEARRRLDVMCRTTDGFAVAEEDLRIRGPGEFLGTRQSGLPDLRVADILRDGELLETARREAFALVERDPGLDAHGPLRAAVEGFWHGKVDIFATG